MSSISQRIAQELGVKEAQTRAAIDLLDEGATVPFISRYRKEVTGGLDDSQMRELETRLGYLRELEERRDTILNSIREQEKLTPELERDILAADTKNRLEDLYLPYKPKRRTKGQIAREAGLEPLADALLGDPSLNPESAAADYLNPEAGILIRVGTELFHGYWVIMFVKKEYSNWRKPFVSSPICLPARSN